MANKKTKKKAVKKAEKKPVKKKSAAKKAPAANKKSAAKKAPAAKKKAVAKKTAVEAVTSTQADYPHAFVHPAATVMGMVELGPDCSIWPGAVLRGDMGPIRLGKGVNIQDNTTLHTDSRGDISIGDYTLVGHNAMLHGCKVGKGCLIGIGSVVLDGAEIGDGAMITAGCMIRGGKKIPPMAMVVQKDGKVVVIEGRAKPALSIAGSLEYIRLIERHRKGIFEPFSPEEEQAMLAEAKQIAVEMGLTSGPQQGK